MKNTQQQKKEKPSEILIRGLKHLIFHNWGFKVLAVLLSILVWAGLISQDETLTRDKTFTDVSVSVSGSDTLKRNGYIVTNDLSEALKGVSAVAAVPSTYGRITSITPESVTVTVEDYVFRYRIPVSVTVTGETPTGWYMSSPSVDTPLVAVSGPRDLVNSISRGRVFLDTSEIEWTEGTAILTGELKLYNRSGEAVESALLEMSYEGVKVDSVVLESTILPTKTFETDDLISTINQVKRGYEVKATHISPESITVAARSEVLDQLNELSLSEHYVDLKNLSETTSFQIKVNKPSDDSVISNDTISVTVEIQPIETEETGST